MKDATGWGNDYSFQRLNGKRNSPATFAYEECLHMLKVRKHAKTECFVLKISSCDYLYVKKVGNTLEITKNTFLTIFPVIIALNSDEILALWTLKQGH